jgi:hypothetical protein
MTGEGEPTSPHPAVSAWREGVDADRRKRPRRVANERAAVRRLTATAAIAATGLGVGLFVQTAIAWNGAGGIQSAIVSVIGTFVPGARLQPPPQTPSAAPGATPVVTTGAS